MCQFNLIALPKLTKLVEVRDIFRAHEFTPVQVFNDSLSKQLPDKLFFVSNKNDCDCGSVINSAHKVEDSVIHQNEREKLKRKGWSEAKIQKAFDNKSKVASHKPDIIAQDRNRWFNLINTLLAGANLKSVGILAHEYSGSINAEKIIVADTYHFTIDKFQPQQLDEFELNTFYEIEMKK